MTKPEDDKEELDYSQMTAQELQILSELDSRQYGFLLLDQPENASKKALIKKAVRYLQMMVVQARTQQKNNENESGAKNISIDPKTWVKLGHFHLLLQEYRKALSAYQMFYKTQAENHWQDTSFLFGLGLVYFHYNAFSFAVKAFQQLLYVSPGFQRANEVNLRLGIMFKVTQEYELAHKHLQLALVDNNPCTATKNEIRFHVAHLFEVQGKVKSAKEKYEALLKDKSVTQSLRADIFRQLGWLYHCQESLGDRNQRVPLAIHCLQRANEADQFSGHTLYLLGRCYASVGKSHDAFIAYRNSVEKSEGNADTWCSIGVLYQQQNQPMDALQAYICAVQLDKCHSAAWANLGILYESTFQARDAYACYVNSSGGAANKGTADDAAKLPKINFRPLNPHLAQRINYLKTHLSSAPLPSVTSQRRQLLPIEEAWNLPISAEMTSRALGAAGGGSRPSAPQTFHKTYPAVAPQGPPPPYPLPNDPAAVVKRFKPDPDQKPVVLQPAYTLSPQQLQLLNHFQQNVGSLNPAQQNMMQHLQHQYRMMQQNQEHAKRQLRAPNAQPVFAHQFRNPGMNQAIVKTEKLVQPQPVVEPRVFMPAGDAQLDDNLEEDLKDLFAQKDLATTFAESLLKHFGAPEMDVKDGVIGAGRGTLSSGPFSPSNIDGKAKLQGDLKMTSTA